MRQIRHEFDSICGYTVFLTTRCNFECEHCLYGCTSVGEDMSEEVFLQMLDFFNTHDKVIIGGGEPTIHPRFEEFLDLLDQKSEYRYHVTTNGSQKEITERLIERHENNPKFTLNISFSQWHGPIDPQIRVKAMQADPNIIRVQTRNMLHNQGRCTISTDPKEHLHCACPCMMVYPNGEIFACGCEGSPKIGTIQDGFYPEYVSLDSRGGPACPKYPWEF